MNKLFLFFLVAVFFSSALAQAPSGNQSNLSINKKSWSFRLFPEYDYNSDADIFRANDDARNYNRAVVENSRQNAYLKSRGMPIVKPPSRPMSTNAPTQEEMFATTGYFTYEIIVKNSSEKKISAVVWDYVFTDIAKHQEAGRRQFKSIKSIRPGESKTLSEKSTIYPTSAIDASKSSKKFSDIYSEQIVILQVEYADGSVWTAPSN